MLMNGCKFLLVAFTGIFENVFELRPEIRVEACQQGLLTWLLKRIKVTSHRYKHFFVMNSLLAAKFFLCNLTDH